MKDQKPEKEQSKRGQRTDQPLTDTEKKLKDSQGSVDDHGKAQERLRSGENQSARSDNNDTLGIP